MADNDENDDFEWLGPNESPPERPEQQREGDQPDDQGPPADQQPEQTAQQVEDDETPLADLANRVRDRDTDPSEDLFEEADVSQVDPDTVWEQLEREEPAKDDPEHEPESRVVEKASYCETCEYFDAPPAMRCTHEGTEIRQLVDFEHVEVYNCPIVRQNDELEQS